MVTDHFDFDSAIGLAGFREHISGTLTEIAQFRGLCSLLYMSKRSQSVSHTVPSSEKKGKSG